MTHWTRHEFTMKAITCIHRVIRLGPKDLTTPAEKEFSCTPEFSGSKENPMNGPGIQNTIDAFKARFFQQISAESQGSIEGFIGMDQLPMTGEDLKQHALESVVEETREFFRSRAAAYWKQAAFQG